MSWLLSTCIASKFFSLQRNIGWPDLAKFCNIFSVVGSQDPLLFRSTLQERPMIEKESFNTLFTWLWFFKHEIHHFLFASHTMFIDKWHEMILLVKFSGSHCNSPIICWIWLRIPTAVNFAKIFHSNSTSCPSIRIDSPKQLLSEHHWICFLTGLSVEHWQARLCNKLVDTSNLEN